MHEHDIDGQLTSQDAARVIIERFPQENLVYAFGYGSGVFSQSLTDPTVKGNMLDIILVVDDAEAFHRENMRRHPGHYASWLRASGAPTAAWMQQNFWLPDARVLFLVVDDDPDFPPMKYGIVHQNDLNDDLQNWTKLYLSGRLQKPTLPILNHPPDAFIEGQHKNLTAAVSAALLLSIPDAEDSTSVHLLWNTLYSRIASLSYTGDFRMQVGGEDPMKIKKLVDAPGQLERFNSLYRMEVLEPLQKMGLLDIKSNHISWNPSDTYSRQHLWGNLPRTLQQDTANENLDVLAQNLSAIVAPAARWQAFKGVFTLGFRKTVRYASAKLSKGLLRTR
jgi:mitochondrial translocator assembly and maintenance protein 41